MPESLTTPYRPRIYFIIAPHPINSSQGERLLAHCTHTGFDHLCLSSAAGLPPTSFQPLLTAAKKQGIAILMDIALDEFDCSDEFFLNNRTIFEQGDPARLPDPRVDTSQGRVRHIRNEFLKGNQHLEELWLRRLLAFADQGFGGFLCRGLEKLPESTWDNIAADLKAAYPTLKLIGWSADSAYRYPPQFDAQVQAISSELLSKQAAQTQVTGTGDSAPATPAPVLVAVPVVSASVYRLQDGLPDEQRHRQDRLYAAARQSLQLAVATGGGLLLAPASLYYAPARKNGMDPFVLDDANPLLPDIRSFNQQVSKGQPSKLRPLPSAGEDQIMLLSAAGGSSLIVVNRDPTQPRSLPLSRLLFALRQIDRILPDTTALGMAITLQPSEIRTMTLEKKQPITVQPEPASREQFINAPRIAIEKIAPAVDDGRFAIKRKSGEIIQVEADVFMDTHDKIGVALIWRAADEGEWQRTPMRLLVNDRWGAGFPIQRVGRYIYAVEAWHDQFGTFAYGLDKKVRAGVEVHVEIQEGKILLEKAASLLKAGSTARNTQAAKAAFGKKLAAILAQLAKPDFAALPAEHAVQEELSALIAQYPQDQRAQIAILLSPHTLEVMREVDPHASLTRSREYIVQSDRQAAEFSSWYEMFPRSQSGDVNRHGTFDDVIRRLPAISAMGFDTLYFTPIHPIGRKNRKGRNNTLEAGPDDPGSPYAIGSAEGGHEALHPELGSWEDFRRMRDEAARNGLEIALDFAIQCAPDHPWLAQHPDWFDWRPDGTIKYAENPPKKYQDIVNVDFYADGAIPDLWLALRDIVLLWVREGVRTFRVDNPHTKPLPFWEWLIRQVQDEYPDVIFLAEAFTAPKMMNRLAKLGFTQSYTYFTWRNTKWELMEYITQLATGEEREFFRPQFFANTPDIHPYFLQTSGRPGYLIRAALASTLSGLWGISSGYELCEADALPGREEFNHSEKYEIRAWDWDRPGNIISEIGLLNRLRKQYPQLQTHLGVHFQPAHNDQMLCYSKIGKENQWPVKEVILVVVNLDPHHPQEAAIELPLYQLGLHDHAEVQIEDVIRGNQFSLNGKWQSIWLNPHELPFAIWRLTTA